MAARHMALGLTLAAVFLAGGKCSPRELDNLAGALHGQSGVGDDLLENARSVKNLSGLSAEDLARQRQLLAQTDERILTSAVSAMDNTATSARQTADVAAEATASEAVIGDVEPQFIEDLKEVTKELVKEQACQTVLDMVAPAPDEPVEGKTWTDLVGEVIDRMVARQWKGPWELWSYIVAWDKYKDGVLEDADQLGQALLADPTAVTLFTRPPVQRAALAYARFCYAVPQMP